MISSLIKPFVIITLTIGLGLIGQATAQEGVAQRVRHQPPNFSPWFDPELPTTREAQAAKPFRIFDNVYYVGLKSYSSYLITTSQGLIVIEATFDYTADLVLSNVKALGFNPADIKYLLITHGHIDHITGAKVIKEATGARVVTSAADWDLYESPNGASYAGYTGAKIPRDMVKGEGDSVTLGDTTIRFSLMPGHTAGGLTMEYTVFDKGKPYKALTLGGLGLPNSPEQTKTYLQSIAKMREIPDVQVLLPNHPFMGNVWEKAEKLAARKPGDPNPFVDSREKILEWFDTLRNAIIAKALFDTLQRGEDRK